MLQSVLFLLENIVTHNGLHSKTYRCYAKMGVTVDKNNYIVNINDKIYYLLDKDNKLRVYRLKETNGQN